MSFPEVPDALKTRYEIQEHVGSGGFATVYQARDLRLERMVALKLYKPLDPRQKRRAVTQPDEAQLAGKVNHPNVVSIYDAGLTDNRLFLVMQYLSGGSLRERMASGAHPLTSTVALQLILVMAEALQEVHNARILHLDIKPENIMFDDRGRAYLTDFGIARLLDENDRAKQTYAIGTGNYAAPEQQRHGSLSRSSDIYSLGVVLFELLTGYLPLGPAPPVLQPPYSPPFSTNDTITASERLVALLSQALRADPERRYASASDFGAAIRAYLDQADEPTHRLHGEGDTRATDRVRFTDPSPHLTPLEPTHYMPGSVRALRDDLVPIPPSTQVDGVLYSHHGVDIGRDAVLKAPVFARGVVRLARGVMAREDVISLTAIELGSDVQAKNLLAPSITLHGSARIVGSLFCRRMGTGQSAISPHVPAGTELGGSLILEEDFAALVADDAAGRPLNSATPRPPAEGRPTVQIASDCVMVAVLGDANVGVGPLQRQLSAIRVAGDVVLGHSNRVQRVEGHHVHIGPGCHVDEVRAQGTLVIEEGCTIGFARAAGGIRLRGKVRLLSPVLVSDEGAIRVEGEVRAMRGVLSSENLFERTVGERTGSLATALLDHPLHQLYERVAPSWLAHLRPATDGDDAPGGAPAASLPPQPEPSAAASAPTRPAVAEPPTARWRAARRVRRWRRG